MSPASDNKCVTCAYLHYLNPEKVTEIRENTRSTITEKRMTEDLLRRLLCYKNLRPDVFGKLKENITLDEGLILIIEAVCSDSDAWKIHQDGVSPEA